MQSSAKPTVSQWWEEIGKIGAEVEAEMKAAINSLRADNDDLVEFQKAKKIYEEMAIIGGAFDSTSAFSMPGLANQIEAKRKEFGDTEQQKIVGPLTHALANKYLTLQEKFKAEEIDTTQCKWGVGAILSTIGFPAAKARADKLRPAISAYTPPVSTTASTSLSSTPSSGSTETSSANNLTSTTATGTTESKNVSPESAPLDVSTQVQASGTPPLSPQSTLTVSTTATPQRTARSAKKHGSAQRKAMAEQQRKFQQAAKTITVVTEYWQAVEGIATKVETETKADTATPSNDDDSRIFNEAKTIYKKMAEIGKSIELDEDKKSALTQAQQIEEERKKFGETQQQKIVGPLTLKLANEYLAVQKEFREKIKSNSSEEVAESVIPMQSITNLEADLVGNPNCPGFLSKLIAEIKKVEGVETVTTARQMINSGSNPLGHFLGESLLAKKPMNELALDLANEAERILQKESPSIEDKQKMARSLVKMLAVLRDPKNKEAIKKVQEDAKQTIGVSSPLKTFFGILALIGYMAALFLTGGKSVAAGYLLTAGKVTLVGTAATLFYYGSEGKFARKQRQFGEAAENNNTLKHS